jgi:hypothetical protein
LRKTLLLRFRSLFSLYCRDIAGEDGGIVGEGRGSVTVPSRSFTERVRLPQWSLNPWVLLLLRCSVVLLGGHVEQCSLVRGACFLGTDGYMRRKDDCGERIDKRKKVKDETTGTDLSILHRPSDSLYLFIQAPAPKTPCLSAPLNPVSAGVSRRASSGPRPRD